MEEVRNDRPRMITGSFKDRESAERAYTTIRDRGYNEDEVNLLMSDDTRKRHFDTGTHIQTEMGNKALEGAGAGAGIGGTIGAIAGAIAAVGTSLVVPGLGLVIAGPVVAALAGAGAGGATGGIIGALVGSGIPEERAEIYENDVKQGSIVMGVKPRNDEDAEYIEREWRSNQGSNVWR